MGFEYKFLRIYKGIDKDTGDEYIYIVGPGYYEYHNLTKGTVTYDR